MNTILKSISVLANGTIEIELAKRPLDKENESDAAYGNHRRIIESVESVEILADLNAELAELGAAAVMDADWQRVRDIAATVRKV